MLISEICLHQIPGLLLFLACFEFLFQKWLCFMLDSWLELQTVFIPNRDWSKTQDQSKCNFNFMFLARILTQWNKDLKPWINGPQNWWNSLPSLCSYAFEERTSWMGLQECEHTKRPQYLKQVSKVAHLLLFIPYFARFWLMDEIGISLPSYHFNNGHITDSLVM